MSSAGEARADAVCGACGQPAAELARFCMRCGAALADQLRAPQAVPEFSLHASTAPPPSRSARSTVERAAVADPLIGRTVADRYRILELIGRGGMGVVYRVEHVRIGKWLALKLLTGELTRDAVQVARFKREALMASHLSHPNTVQVFDFGTSDGLVYLAMEYLRGEDLGRIIRREGHLASDRAAKLVVQIASSLAEAHEKGIVHRDLKPENILVVRGHSGEEIVKVLDFGLAKLRESSELSDVTTRGAIVGTPYYMSPEQIRSDPVDPRSDVYSLGALLYACLTGGPVFDAATPLGVFTKHLLEPPVPPQQRRPDLNIPSGVGRIVMRALEKDPNQRLPSVVELRRLLVEEVHSSGQASIDQLLSSGELLRLRDDDNEAATRAEIERYTAKLRRRSRIGYVALLSVVLVVVGSGITTYRRLNQPPSFDGTEREPNDAATLANPLPFGLDVRGFLGKRLDAERSDRDFFRVQVPAPTSVVQLKTSALPNLAMCTWIYHSSSNAALGRYCAGAPGRALHVQRLALPAGEYLVSVMQDRDGYSKSGPPPVFENVSDQYQLQLAPASLAGDHETEPNDTRDHPGELAVPGISLAQLAFMRDVDVFCAPAAAGDGSVRFVLDEAEQSPRGRDGVLQVTALAGPDANVPVRVHRTLQGFKATARDRVSPWISAWLPTGGGSACIEVTAVPNPWAPDPPEIAPASDAVYTVRTEQRPPSE